MLLAKCSINCVPCSVSEPALCILIQSAPPIRPPKTGYHSSISPARAHIPQLKFHDVFQGCKCRE
jgi:hypothetical protein